MFNFTPPSVVFCCTIILALWIGTLFSACATHPASNPSDFPDADKALFRCPDSLLLYARKAYLEDDAFGLYVTGAAAFLYADDPAARDSLTVVSTDEAAIMLLRSAALHSDDALRVIHYLHAQSRWHWSIPEQFEQ